MSEDSTAESEFGVFFKANRHRLVKVVAGWTGDLHLAEDVAQEVMLKLRSSWGRYDRPEILMFQMARQDLGRRKERQKSPAPSQTVPLDDRIEEVDRQRQSRAADTTVEDFDMDSAVMKAVRSLPDRQMEVVVLLHLCGLTNTEAGEVLGISPKDVATHKARAHRKLKSLLPQPVKSEETGAGQAV